MRYLANLFWAITCILVILFLIVCISLLNLLIFLWYLNFKHMIYWRKLWIRKTHTWCDGAKYYTDRNPVDTFIRAYYLTEDKYDRLYECNKDGDFL